MQPGTSQVLHKPREGGEGEIHCDLKRSASTALLMSPTVYYTIGTTHT